MKRAMKSLCKHSTLAMAIALSLPATSSYGQHTYHNERNHIYQSVATIFDGGPWQDNSIHGQGYTVASTAPKSIGDIRGEIMRLDNNGNQIWVNFYDAGRPHRFNHIEKYADPNSGLTEYLVVGSIDDGSKNTMLIARVDDNGAVVRSHEYGAVEYDQLIGIKGLYSREAKEFVIVAEEYDGHNTPGKKRVIVMGLDLDLNPTWSYYINSNTGTTDDWDYVSDVIETPNGYLVLGTCNGNFQNFPPSVMMVMINSGGLIWDASHTYGLTADFGASAYYDEDEQAVWVLLNAWKNASFKLGMFDLNGNYMQGWEYNSPTKKDKYGFSIVGSAKADEKALVIAAYDYGTGAGANADPMLLNIDKGTGAITWQNIYYVASNGILNYNENPILRMAYPAAYFHNDILNYRSDYGGYVVVAADLTGGTGTFGTRVTATDIAGDLPTGSECKYEKTDMKEKPNDIVYTKIDYEKLDVPNKEIPLKDKRIDYEQWKCGSLAKYGVTSATALANANTLSVYPNPVENTFSIQGFTENAQLAIYDINGRVLISQKLTGTSQTINIAALPAGTYMLQVVADGEQTHRQVLQKL